MTAIWICASAFSSFRSHSSNALRLFSRSSRTCMAAALAANVAATSPAGVSTTSGLGATTGRGVTIAAQLPLSRRYALQ